MSASPVPSPRAGAPGPRAHALSALLILASAASLAVALTLPTVTFRQVGSPAETYSIYGGIRQLWLDGTRALSAVVFLFSIVFPIAKLLALALVCLGVGCARRRRATVRWLELLGKWSMLDVFIVATFVGSIRLGALAGATSRAGILVFGGSILLSMVSTRLIGRVELGGEGLPLRADARLRRLPQALLSAAALATLVAAFALPVFEVKKALVFRSELALWRTTRELFADGEAPLALALAAFVIATTAARALLVLRLRLWGGGGVRLRRWVLWLEEWSMLDVFALGLVVVHTKLDQLTDTSRQAGFTLVLVAAALCELDAVLYRRAVLGREPRGV